MMNDELLTRRWREYKNLSVKNAQHFCQLSLAGEQNQSNAERFPPFALREVSSAFW